MDLVKEAKNRISNGKIEEALNFLSTAIDSNKNYELEILNIQARLSKNRNDFGSFSEETILLERNRIIHSTLEIASLIEYDLRSQYRNSEKYLLKARTHSWLKDSFIEKAKLEAIRSQTDNPSTESDQYNEYLVARIEKLRKINKWLTITIGAGLFGSILYNFYVIKLIKDFLVWDHANHVNINVLTENENLRNSEEEIHELDHQVHDSDFSLHKDLDSNSQMTNIDLFIKGPKTGLRQKDNQTIENTTEVTGSHDQDSPDLEIDFDINLDI